MTNINLSFLISLIIIALGFTAKKTGIVKETDGEGISRIVFNFTLPAVVISTFGNIKIDYSILFLPLICVLYGLLMTFLALFVFRKMQKKEKGTLVMLSAAFNIGLFAYPLVEMIWGQEGLKHFGMFDMGNAFIVFGSNFIIASIFAQGEAKIDFKKLVLKVLSSIPFLAYIMSLTLAILQVPIPAFFLDITKVIAKANMPLCLLLLGIYLSFDFDKSTLKKMISVILMRYSIGIITGIIMFFFMPFDPLFKITLLLGFSLPVSLAVLPYSVEFGYDSKFIGTVSNATIIISFILMWTAVFLTKTFGL
ncbi:MAG: AEC family transporter [Spirochaetes bacterium]|nr:AEC family transporter [Spirochaetota bacterium]